MELIKFIFSDLWICIGFLITLGMILNFTFVVINRILRSRNIRKLGYPPPHCDADGDFKDEKK